MRKTIGVMGAAQGPLITEENKKNAYAVGKAIAEAGAVIITGATTGLPCESTVGATENGGMSVGISPARNKKEHIEVYKKPTDNMDTIVFTGYGYTARNVLNIRSSEGVIVLPGGIGTMTEFTSAYEEEKVIGILTVGGGMSEVIPKVIAAYYRKNGAKVFYDDDPARLVKKVIDEL